MTTPITPGIPLLSGPPPQPWPPEASACRKCGKEFNMFFNRQRKCMHCGYGYCSSCTDYQALMPRTSPPRGHDLAHVCAYCIELLHMTALSKSQLRALPLSKLRRYLDAYNIQIKDPVDKNDFVDTVCAARMPQGCLPPANEAYYRKHSVPKYNASSPHASRARNLFSRASSGTTQSWSTRSGTNARPPGSGSTGNAADTSNYTRTSFPRPDLDASRERQAQGAPDTPYEPRSAPAHGARTRTTSTPQNSGAPRSHTSRPTTRPTSSHTSTPRPSNSSGGSTSARAPPRPAPRAPSPTPPPLSTVLTFTRSEVAALSIAMLKKILWDARVRLPPGVFEKSELVDRVWGVLQDERMKEEQEDAEDVGVDEANNAEEVQASEGERDERVTETMDPESEIHTDSGGEVRDSLTNDERHVTIDAARDVEMGELDQEHLAVPDFNEVPSPRPTALQSSQVPDPSSSSSPVSPSNTTAKVKSRPRPTKPSDAERSGLCVVCQDEEATIAIVDCGHLAMCRACSDLVLASSRECPLCRTRIVTEARLLRIFKT